MFQFHHADDAKKALEQLNGFELAGRKFSQIHLISRFYLATPKINKSQNFIHHPFHRFPIHRSNESR